MFLIFLFLLSFSFSFRLPHDFHHPNIGPDNVTQLSGYITVNGTWRDGTHLFYWLFESRSNPETSPFIIWLTGGPGCSSQLALLTENGPYILNKKLELEINPYSWNEFANIMWIDQPAGTGFSYTDHILDYTFDEKQVAKDMWNFLQEFFQQFPKYHNMDLYVLGESYAGHYVPAISYKIDEANKKHEGPLQLNLKGLGIGNGWVDPYRQYRAYAEFANDNKLLTEKEYKVDIALNDVCQGLIAMHLWTPAFFECGTYMNAVTEQMSVFLNYSINPYNWKIPCAYPPLCYDFTDVTTFLNKKSVQEALGVNKEWEPCANAVHFAMLGDWMRNLEKDVPTLLESKYKVLVYSGELDFICNWRGGEAWTKDMKWKGQEEFNKQSYVSWKVDGEDAGWVKSYENLTFLRVSKAGHMVPMDQPKHALAMLKNLLDGTPFSS